MWRAGAVAETGETSHGTSTITSELGGRALLRRDHVELFGKDARPQSIRGTRSSSPQR